MALRRCDETSFDDVGDGTPVVVFPGGPARHADYLERLGGLDGRGFRLLVIHPRGTGGTPEPEDPALFAATRQADDVERLRDLLGLETIALVAHSAGAAVAYAYAAAHPDRLHRLVLVTPATSPLGLVDTEEESERQLAAHAGETWYPAARAAVDQMEVDGPTPELRAAMRPLLYGSWTAHAQAHAAGDAPQSNLRARQLYFRERLDPAALRHAMARVACPVRILLGERDLGPGPQLGAELAALFPDAQLLTQPGAGHFPWVDDADAFSSLMVEALG